MPSPDHRQRELAIAGRLRAVVRAIAGGDYGLDGGQLTAAERRVDWLEQRLAGPHANPASTAYSRLGIHGDCMTLLGELGAIGMSELKMCLHQLGDERLAALHTHLRAAAKELL